MTEDNSERAKTLERIDGEWQWFLDVTNGFSEEELLLPRAVGHWTAKDMIGHVATWEDELIKKVERFRSSGEKTSYGGEAGVDRFNEAEAEKKRGLSLSQVWDELHQSHQRLLDFLRGLPDEAFTPGTYTGDWMAVDSADHYREHREDLERWRAFQG